MVFFYGDESGTNGEGDYVLSGYLAHKTTWDLFSQNWKKFLAIGGISYLKMSQWEHRDPTKKQKKKQSGEFLGMINRDATIRLDAMVDLLCTMLKTGAIAEYTVSISWDLYRKHIDGYCRQVFDDPFYFLMLHIVKMALHDLKVKSPNFKDKIHFVFDSGNSAERHAQKHFHLLKHFSPTEVSKHIGALTFEDDKVCPPLQAADMIAWHTRRALVGFPKDEDGSRRIRYDKLQSAARAGIRGVAMEERLKDFNRRVNELSEYLAEQADGDDKDD